MHLIFILVLWSSLVLAQSRTLVFEFEPVEGATTYDFEFRVQGTSEVVRKLSQKNAEVEITLPLNKYEYRQRTADRRKVSGSWSNWEKFDVSAPEIKITSPKVDDVIDSNEAKSKKVEIAWSGGEAVDEFNVKIIDQFSTGKISYTTGIFKLVDRRGCSRDLAPPAVWNRRRRERNRECLLQSSPPCDP